MAAERGTFVSTAVVMTAFQRPDYLQRTLVSWDRARSTLRTDSMRRVFIEPSPEQHLMVRLSSDHGWAPRVWPERKGVLVNPVSSVSLVFLMYDHVDFVILAEEDVVVATDVLEYFSWAKEEYRDNQSVGVVCAHRPQLTTVPVMRPNAVLQVPGFSCPLVWGTWRDRWENFIEPTWDRDYTNRGWDWNLTMLMKLRGMCSVVPEQNRSDHIGEHGGVHCTPEMYPGTVDPDFTEEIGVQDYRLVGGPA